MDEIQVLHTIDACLGHTSAEYGIAGLEALDIICVEIKDILGKSLNAENSRITHSNGSSVQSISSCGMPRRLNSFSG